MAENVEKTDSDPESLFEKEPILEPAEAVTIVTGGYLKTVNSKLFVRGTRPGPGRPKLTYRRNVSLCFDAAVADVFDTTKFIEILNVVRDQALAGDTTSQRLIVDIAKGNGLPLRVDELQEFYEQLLEKSQQPEYPMLEQADQAE